jgi:hypothetical protein
MIAHTRIAPRTNTSRENVNYILDFSPSHSEVFFNISEGFVRV